MFVNFFDGLTAFKEAMLILYMDIRVIIYIITINIPLNFEIICYYLDIIWNEKWYNTRTAVVMCTQYYTSFLLFTIGDSRQS